MLALLVSFALIFTVVAGQSTNATCLNRYDWTENSLGQSPCLVAAYLESQCLDSALTIPALPNGTHYLGPRTIMEADPCKCSTVAYNLVSACGACQNRTWQNWGNWSANCPVIEFGYFPKSIPQATEVPLWAYLNITDTNGTFDLAATERNQSASQNEAPGSTATSSTSVSTASVDIIATSTSRPNESDSPNTGVIAGAVVGALAGAVVLGLMAFWVFTRRHRSMGSPRSVSEGANLNGGGVPTSPALEHDNYIERNGPSPMSTVPTPYRYDTSERSMSPVSQITSGIYTTFGRSSLESLPPQTQRPSMPSAYRGTPEV